MKKIITAVLAVTMAVGMLTGCGSGSGTGKKVASGEKLVIWTNMTWKWIPFRNMQMNGEKRKDER